MPEHKPPEISKRGAIKYRGEQPTPEGHRNPLNELILIILESHNNLRMDDLTDRQRLADVLTEAVWEAVWRMENGLADNFDDPSRGYEPEDLYGL